MDLRCSLEKLLEILVIYNELSSAAYTPQQCCEFLQSAVTGVPNLENIKTNIIASRRSAGVTTPLSYKDFKEFLKTAAQVDDEGNIRY